ncbi:MAG: mannosyltransferase [Vicingaceae bacterium]|nr:mannosyltransferase [Vicingaceae bacterium]
MKLISTIKNNPILFYALIGLSAIGYFLFAYHTQRADYAHVFVVYAALFLLFVGMYQTQKNNFLTLAGIGILFRIIFIVAIPNLSQDFYRFIWDGRMLLNGFNPYLFTPESFIQSGELPINQAQELYQGMGQLNGSNFTNYPPINQLCFVLANLFGTNSILGSVIGLRFQLILADIGILYFGKKLLEKLHLPVSTIFLYFLNPFIIIELTGNLHFEGVMLFFLVWSLYLLHTQKWKWAAILLALSVSVKLIPLIFLPLFYQRFKLKQLLIFYGITLVTFVVLFIPFFNTAFIVNYSESIGLWFKTFEFNASFYYIARAIGYQISGYNQIAVIGKILPVVVVLIILGFTFFRENKTSIQLITAMLLSLSIYFLLSTTVHPWYVASLVFLSVFTKYRFALVWSFSVILSYSAYSNNQFNENLWIVALEYLLVLGWFIWEMVVRKKHFFKLIVRK